jgi:glycosyltransferase involved in cell wall biosynthesis
MDSIIVFSHLRWDFVYQRPQHLLSRLSKTYHIIFFEEPVYTPGKSELQISSPLPNLTICRPLTSVNEQGFTEKQIDCLRGMVQSIAARNMPDVAWFYTPMALPLADELSPRCVVYDCMDELSLFKDPPPNLLMREKELLEKADIVFTGGPSLYKAKRSRHRNVHCFPSSVDANHFRQALDRNIAHPSQSSLPCPRLGFYGVIDERLDTALIGAVAAARPDWQIVLVGPVVSKIDPSTLPDSPNVHYMGQQAYKDLPRFLAAWDVCLMPFAMNDATRFISPTKSLEYMAAELPIVSTPVTDVVDAHSDVVDIASTPEEFISACEHALEMSDEERFAKLRAMREKLAHTSWDATAASMGSLLSDLLGARGAFPGVPGNVSLYGASSGAKGTASSGGMSWFRE